MALSADFVYPPLLQSPPSIHSDTGTDSSLPPSTPATSIIISYPFPSPPPPQKKHPRSFSLRRRPFPTQHLSSLLRSHSSKQRGSSSPPQITAVPSRGYAVDDDMYTPHDPERPSNSRKAERRKSEHRIYNFLTRSRSRSRSRQRRPSSTDGTPKFNHPPLPTTTTTAITTTTGYSHHRHSSASPTSLHSPSKPTSRLPSRPLSSTTTATHSTITPLPPIPTTRERGRRRKYIPTTTTTTTDHNPDLEAISVPNTHALDSSTSGSVSSRQSTSKPPSTTRMKLQSIFGIPFSVNKSSRPVSPQREDHGDDGDHDPTPTKHNLFRSTSSRPPAVSRPQSPSPGRSNDKPKSTWRLFSNKSNPSSRTNLRSAAGTTPQVSAPLMLNRQTSASSSRSSVPSPASLPKPRTNIPKINHIPPTPLKTPRQSRSNSRTGVDDDGAIREVVRGQRHDRTGSVGSSVNGGGAKWTSGLFGGGGGNKDKERSTIGTSSTRSSTGSSGGTKKNKIPASARVTHGSFDFENPGGLYLSRSLDKGKVKMKDPAQQKRSSSRRVVENNNKVRTGHDRSMPPLVPATNRDHRPKTATVMTHHTSVSVSSNGHPVSTTTTTANTNNNTNRSSAQSPTTPASSSFGRSTGRTALRGGNAGHTHGSFAFEPAVHVPSPNSDSLAQQQPGQITRSGSGSTTTEGGYNNNNNNNNNKSHGKGRSLDLGLGLAWAPTKVRPEAVIQSGFGRSLSTRDGGNGRGREGGRIGGGGGSGNVTETFKAVLSESGFSAFKRYVRRFDANSIPFDGPTGIITRVEQLLDSAAPAIGEMERRDLMDRFIRVILQNA